MANVTDDEHGKPPGEGSDRLPEGVERVRASNPGPLTLSGTNTYLVGSPAWVVDPGPDDADQVERVLDAAQARGGIEGIVLTHGHLDHAGAATALQRVSGAPLAVPAAPQGGRTIGGFTEPSAGDLSPDLVPAEGDRVGPFQVFETPGHSPDHVSYLFDTVLFCGDTVLGEGSVFVPPGDDSMRAYLDSLAKLERLELTALCPGHGPVVWDPHDKIAEYIAHRLDRERRLIDALAQGLRSREELLDAAWSEVPPQLRPAAALTLEAHAEKLETEGRLPGGVERIDY